ncbi:MAG: coiled-coil domain-containing protein [Candidatus Hermodarchaeota archaeon]
MSDEKKTLNVIDETIQAAESSFKEFIDVLETSRTALLKLENDKIELSNVKEQLETEKIQLEEEKNKLENVKRQLEADKKKLEEETRKLEIEKQERDQKIGSLTEEQMKLLDEYRKVKVELEKFMKAAEEAEEAEYNFERVRALLSIYTVLVSEIWQGQPHYRILMTLHGETDEMSRDQIKNTTGIGGAFVLHSVQELAKVGLVDYDMDTGMVKLKKRLFPKKALEEKK